MPVPRNTSGWQTLKANIFGEPKGHEVLAVRAIAIGKNKYGDETRTLIGNKPLDPRGMQPGFNVVHGTPTKDRTIAIVQCNYNMLHEVCFFNATYLTMPHIMEEDKFIVAIFHIKPKRHA